MDKILKAWTDKGIGQCDTCNADITTDDPPIGIAGDNKLYCHDCVEGILETKIVQAAIELLSNTKGLQLAADPDLIRRYRNLLDAVDAINAI